MFEITAEDTMPNESSRQRAQETVSDAELDSVSRGTVREQNAV